MIAFAHGSGSSRRSPESSRCGNSQSLQLCNPASRSFDGRRGNRRYADPAPRFDIPMLANRLVDIAAWLQNESQTKALKIGWFGASTEQAPP
jgi:hypothetical protein